MANESSARSDLPFGVSQLTELARQSLGQMTPEQCLRGELVVATRGAVDRARTGRAAWQTGAGLALAAGLVLASVQWLRHHEAKTPGALSYVVENGASSEGRSIDVDNAASSTVRFSDGTEVRLDQGTHAQIRRLSDRGAEVAMSRGTLHAAVIHSPASEWSFDAGPFVVHVTGTEFGLSWAPEQDRFDLRLEHGSVTVSSPVVSDPIPVRAGQWLTIHPHSNRVFLRDLVEPAPSDEPRDADSGAPSSAKPELADAPATSTAPSFSNRAPMHAPSAVRSAPQPEPQPEPPAAPATHAWAQALAQGKVRQIVDEALQLGLDDCLARSSASELSALADAARYTRRDDVARKALMAERQRFAGTRVAADAAMLLGRLAEAGQNDGQALRWFDTYLTEAPGGAYAAEALGRKMAVVRHTGGSAGARALAEEYIKKYPEGTYSSAARAILNSP